MPRQKKSDPEGGEPPDGKRKRPPKLGNPDADPVQIHRDFVERRLGGGSDSTSIATSDATSEATSEATSDAYARAIKQWHELPGAVSAPPTEIVGEDAVGTSTDEGESAETEAADDSPDDEPPA